ncbi:DUF5679 domain-containing protein [Chloroflexota bacterium]
MSQAYCLKCRKMVEIQNPERVILKNMTPALTGKCALSGTTVFRFVHRRLDPVYVLVLAIEREKRARQFYLDAADKTSNIRGKEMYNWLASQSLLNSDDLQQQLTSLQVGNLWLKWEEKTPALVRSEFPKRSSGVTEPYEPNADEVVILRSAIKTERKAVAFYKENEQITTDPDGKLAFEMLAQRKVGHLGLLEAQLEWVVERSGYFSIDQFIES